VRPLVEELRRLADGGAAEVPREDLPALVAAIAAAQGALVARAITSPAPAPIEAPAPAPAKGERVLTVSEAADRFGRSRWWIYRNANSLPGRVALPGGGYGFREKSVDRWIQRKG
jgi:predicted DNA-binding transcriptional regulator AlpA